ncbi:hypothetical protein CASFOL_024775 [Castilleja foliolosa]|uniref:DRBM domain-containing protein n=1 Tax=Castilleja foliolosa TaxID=1961234 RepID=A0ABD3CPB0_9LAMI
MMGLTEEVQEKNADQDNSDLIDSTNKDGVAKKRSAKTNLHELCARQHWKGPVYQCCNEEGPDHHKLFTYKVSVDVEEKLTTLECYGNPRANKKAAAENAAEAALWCLKNMGYQLINK